MVYCSKCGKKNEDAAEFCVSCGTALYPEETREKRVTSRLEKRRQDECFGLPHGGAIVGIFFGIVIILVGLTNVLGLKIDIGPFVIVIIGILIVAGAIYGLTRKRS